MCETMTLTTAFDHDRLAEDADIARSAVSAFLARLRPDTSSSRLATALAGSFLRLKRDGDDSLAFRPYGVSITGRVSESSPGRFAQAVSGGSRSLLQSYAAAEWQTDDLYQICCALHRAETIARRARYIALPIDAVASLRRARRRPRDYDDVALHYDLPAGLFQATLDPVGAYSSAQTRAFPTQPAAAYARTYDVLLKSLGLPQQGGRILDLGAGWGAFAAHVLETSPHSITAITVSEAQASHLSEAFEANLGKRFSVVNASFIDPADRPSDIDAIVMLESFEHLHPADRRRFLVGLAEQYPTAPLFIQVTARPTLAYLQRAGSPAIVPLIFPGPGDVPSVPEILWQARRAGYRPTTMNDLTAEYHALVLGWLSAFRRRKADLEIDIPPQLLRAWEFYLAGLAAALAFRNVTNHQILLHRQR